jgi:hypothetical protein
VKPVFGELSVESVDNGGRCTGSCSQAVFCFEDDQPRFSAVLRILKLLQGAVAAQRHDRHSTLRKVGSR